MGCTSSKQVEDVPSTKVDASQQAGEVKAGSEPHSIKEAAGGTNSAEDSKASSLNTPNGNFSTNGVTAQSEASPDQTSNGLQSSAASDSQQQKPEIAESAPLLDPNFIGCPVLPNDAERNQAVCSITDNAHKRDPQFDEITKLLCQIFHVPLAVVSVLDAKQQWAKGETGMDPALNPIDRKFTFCAWTLLPQYPEVLVVQDATKDMRFADNPLVTQEGGIRFYAGAPLVTSSGHRVGSLCVIDFKPRELEAESLQVLINFAEVVVRELEKESLREQESQRLTRKASGLLRAFDSLSEGIMVCNSSSSSLEILFLNDVWCKMTGMVREEAMNKPLWEIFDARGSKEEVSRKAEEAIKHMKPFSIELMRKDAMGMMVRFTASFRPGVSEQLDGNQPAIAIPGAMSSLKEDGVFDNLYFCSMQTIIRSADSLVGDIFRETPSIGPSHPFEDVQLGPLLGQGSFGRVYRGMWNGAYVAVKIILPPPSNRQPEAEEAGGSSNSYNTEPGAMECIVTAQLQHPNIVMTYKSAQVALPTQAGPASAPPGFETWLVLEYCDSGNLRYAIDRGRFDKGFAEDGKRSGLPDLFAIRTTAMEIAAALCYLHEKDILHGDLCSANVLLCAASRDKRGFVAKVADFGMARLVQDTVTTMTYGTVTHMPPELLTDGQLSRAADSFAWGAILWELFSIHRPWTNMMPMQVMYNVTVLKKSLQFPDCTPDAYKELGEACLSPDPQLRPTMVNVIKRLQELPC